MAILRSCVGCGLGIDDLYYLVVGSKFCWHLGCLKCSQCQVLLHSEEKCYLNNGKFYCVNDYVNSVKCKSSDESEDRLELELNKKPNHCQTCKQSINSSDYVIRLSADESLLYHLGCFMCHECGTQIAPGHQYALLNEHVYCHQHYFTQLTQIKETDYSQTSLPNVNFHALKNNETINNHQPRLANIFDFNNGSPDAPQSLAQNSSASTHFVQKSKKSKNLPQSQSGIMTSSMISKKKRNRTSFKHQQLRIMKAHFQVNQNPDAKDLKELSERTGLQKRVLQVWFQNSRAKQRKSTGGGGGGGSLLGTNPQTVFSFKDEQNFDTNSNNSNIVSTNSSMNLEEEEEEDGEGLAEDEDELGDEDTLGDEDLSGESDDENAADEIRTEESFKKKSKKSIFEQKPQFFNHNQNNNNQFQHQTHQSNIPLVDFYHYY